MTIKEWRRKFAKLDVIDLGDHTYLWHCASCGKSFKITHEQVCHMISCPDETILCESCDELALFVIKRNEKYLYYGQNSEGLTVKKWTSIIADAKKFDKDTVADAIENDSYIPVLISHPQDRSSYEEYINSLIEEI